MKINFLNKLFGYRWSLYIVQNGNQLVYAMHENAVIKIAGYVMAYYADGGMPVEPWSLYLNFNHKHQNIRLGPEHFALDGENVTPLLIQQIESIDPGWKVKGGEPVFEEAATKNSIPIQESDHDFIQSALGNKRREVTFFRVMDDVFGKER
jgi:hypothetical protein